MDVEIKTMDLSFCGEVAHNIVNKEAKEFILNQLKNKYKSLKNINMHKTIAITIPSE